MSAMDPGGSAFPVLEQKNVHGEIEMYAEPGMTLRDYFAIKALAALIGNAEWFAEAKQNVKFIDITADEYFSKAAYRLADAMLKARKQ